MLEHEVASLAFEFSRKGTALFGHLTPRSGEQSRLNGCPVSLDPYISERNAQHLSNYLIVSKHGKRMTAVMLRKRWDEAREQAKKAGIEGEDLLLAGRIAAFQFRDIRPKAASEIKNIENDSMFLGHAKSDITKRVYRRLGTTAKPSK
ncbi:hypothetical protein [Pseudomonas lundensis]|uniref:Site-specific recombinase, integrase family n=1 Tax=Pseudomonas lundensis TaxID=86185 RepID=A0AAX2H665_9PSED